MQFGGFERFAEIGTVGTVGRVAKPDRVVTRLSILVETSLLAYTSSGKPAQPSRIYSSPLGKKQSVSPFPQIGL